VVNDGRLLAYSADKGEKLFEVQTGLRGGMGPPITYMLDGKQYVSLMGGTGTPSPNPNAAGGGGARGAEPPPPDIAGAAAQGQRGDAPAPAPGPGATPATPPVPPRLLTFVLDGKEPLQ
jgi:quinohemoprotein ethanol dehydrogenase